MVNKMNLYLKVENPYPYDLKLTICDEEKDLSYLRLWYLNLGRWFIVERFHLHDEAYHKGLATKLQDLIEDNKGFSKLISDPDDMTEDALKFYNSYHQKNKNSRWAKYPSGMFLKKYPMSPKILKEISKLKLSNVSIGV